MNDPAKPVVAAGKYVEVRYSVIDSRTGSVLTEIEHPLGYVHGVHVVMAPAVAQQLEGKAEGDRVEVPIDCNEVYGPRDESLVMTELLDNVPKEYHKVGTAILMENDLGQTKSFMVTRIQGNMITIDGNNPLCGRHVVFKVDVVTVRDATDKDIAFTAEPGGAPND